jgi:hypothetical protein
VAPGNPQEEKGENLPLLVQLLLRSEYWGFCCSPVLKAFSMLELSLISLVKTIQKYLAFDPRLPTG